MVDQLSELVRRLGLRSEDDRTWSGSWGFIGSEYDQEFLFIERVCEEISPDRKFVCAYPLWTESDREWITRNVTGNATFTEWLYDDCRARIVVAKSQYKRWFHTELNEESQRLVTIHMMDQKATLENRGSIRRGRELGIITGMEGGDSYRQSLRELEQQSRIKTPAYEYRQREGAPYLEGWPAKERQAPFTRRAWRMGRRKILGQWRGDRERTDEDCEEEAVPFFNPFLEMEVSAMNLH